MNPIKKIIICFCLWHTCSCLAQGPTSNWYFGYYAGLNFATNPPTVLNNNAMYVVEGVSCISDNSGNLLLYTDGMTVWNKQHQIMANGTGLLGNPSSVQGVLVVKQPGNQTMYYIFTVDAFGGSNGLRYNIVDLSLAAGLGSVTTKNSLLYTPSLEGIAGVKHCNGTDVWIVSHENNSTYFKSYLLSSGGLNSTPVLSQGAHESFSTVSIKISPSGKKLAILGSNMDSAVVYNFNPLTGVVSNPLKLTLSGGTDQMGRPYGEFSPDGTKLYTYCLDTTLVIRKIVQWDLCAGSNSAILASQYKIPMLQTNIHCAAQLSENGKIYIVNIGDTVLNVINNPNALGSACNYSNSAQSVAPNFNMTGLPNFVSSYFYQPSSPPPFTSTVNFNGQCHQVSFLAPFIATCSAQDNTISSLLWNFGEPGSGSANSSALINPSHIYNAAGSYTVRLILNYECRSDTIKQTINLTAANLSLSGKITICKGETSTLTVAGMSTYSWSTTSTNSFIIVSPTITSIYAVTGNDLTNNCSISKTMTVTIKECTSIETLNSQLSGITIYPNPTKGVFSLDLNENAEIKITDLSGRTVYEESLQKGKHEIDLSNYFNGLYLLQAKNNNFERTIKLVKE